MKVHALSFLFLALLSQNTFAEDFDLPPPPEVGSRAYKNDFIELHLYQDRRTQEDCAKAEKQVNLDLRNGFGPDTGVLTNEEVKDSELLAIRVEAEVLPIVTYYKFRYDRPRPYVTDPSLSPCIDRAGSFDPSYPSAHAALGYALSIELAMKYPEKRDAILAQGLKIGNNRLIGGVHHPSDISAGRELAKHIIRDPLSLLY